jgi:signal transduction histidine kinase/ligand-binding sensor domain-containing protein/DNA-binding response OmpR family regulator
MQQLSFATQHHRRNKQRFFRRSFRLLLLLSLLFLSNPLRPNNDKFYGIKDNLSNSHVNSICQDNAGYIWISTDNGLNRFDGSSFKTYYHTPNDPHSLINNLALTVLEDSRGRLWVGTGGGLQLFDRETERFQSIPFACPNVTDFSYISCIIEDSRGNIWFSTSRSGAICLQAGTLRPVYYMPANSNICSNRINTILEDRFGNIWLGSQDNGISVLNADNRTMVNYAHNANDPHSLSSNNVFSIVETPDGNILVGTIDGGIDLFDRHTRRFTRRFIPSVNAVFTLKNGSRNNLWIGTDGFGLKTYDYTTRTLATCDSEVNSINMLKAKVHSIFEDHRGNLWIALYQKGILMIPQREKRFSNIAFNPFHPDRNIGGECVLTVLQDHAGDVWIGTDGDGIYRLHSPAFGMMFARSTHAHHIIQRKVKRHYLKDKLPDNVVLTLFEDSRHRLWAGAYLHGLALYDPHTDAFRRVPIFNGRREIKTINVIRQAPDGNLWIGTNEDGICIFNPDTKTARFLTFDILKKQNQLLSNTIHTICFGRNHSVWIGTSSAGLSRYNLQHHTFDDFNAENGRLLNNNIYAVVEDSAGNVWVGTKQGLHCIDLRCDTTHFYTEADGLANASVCGIEIDRYNNLWISTSRGMSHYDVATSLFTNYYTSNGLHVCEFRRGAHYRSPSGELFFGGIEGLTSFYPFQAKTSHRLAGLLFTDLYIYNKKVESEPNILPKNINATTGIRLSYNIRNFSLGFIAPEYNHPDNVIYQVKMENFDNQWTTLPPGNRLATYTNLRHGRYRFHVRANLPGTEPIERSIEIFIAPPSWATWWAKAIYFFAILAAIALIFLKVKKQIQRRNAERQKENEAHIMQSKLQFFTDVSHEIRTPLTLILTPVEKLISETPPGRLRVTYRRIYQNGQRMLRMVNQLMEMRMLDRGQVELSAVETDPQPFLAAIASSFQSLAQDRDITFTLSFADPLPQLRIDREKLDKVVFNVLSNAFKYTPQHGKITMTVDLTPTDLRIRIADTGEGIPPELRDVIFNRFYRVPSDTNRLQTGTGIGLHLSRSLMEMHHGKIYVEDNPTPPGSLFVILLPLNANYPDSTPQPQIMPQTPLPHDPAAFLPPLAATSAATGQHKRYKILIVEDDCDIRRYLAEIFIPDYHVLEACDGYQALETCIAQLPDCVITDVMMPKIDGIDLCRNIKTDEKTCHIPVVILTARTAIEQRIEGLEVGADAYIPKPFNIDLLKTHVRKLIELRRTIEEKYGGKYELLRKDIRIKSVDEKFIEKLEQIVTEQMSNPDLSVETISSRIGISRSQLQRKLKQLIGQNPSDYLKTYRLKYAAMLLTSKNLSISEVSYATGFSSLSHFSNSFREFYHMSPSRYVELNRQAEAGELPPAAPGLRL